MTKLEMEGGVDQRCKMKGQTYVAVELGTKLKCSVEEEK